MVNRNQFVIDVRKEKVCYIVIPISPSNVIIYQVLAEVEKFITEHQEIILENVPNGLPLVRIISHCMDMTMEIFYQIKNLID